MILKLWLAINIMWFCCVLGPYFSSGLRNVYQKLKEIWTIEKNVELLELVNKFLAHLFQDITHWLVITYPFLVVISYHQMHFSILCHHSLLGLVHRVVWQRSPQGTYMLPSENLRFSPGLLQMAQNWKSKLEIWLRIPLLGLFYGLVIALVWSKLKI